MTLSVSLRHRLPGLTLQADFVAPPGLTALFGRSGAGKTSLVNAVAGLLSPDHGRISCEGVVLFDSAQGLSLPAHRRRIGYVFQDARLFPHLTVRQNLLYATRFAARRGSIGLDQVVALLDIAPLLGRRITDLSGGERQRIAIGRALMSNPRLLLMDEPLAALDHARKAEILPYLERLRDEAGLPILYVSHALSEIARLATTVVVMEAGQVTACGPVELVLSDPALAPLLGLREAGAILPATLIAQDADGLSQLSTSAGPIWLPRVEAPLGTVLRIRIAAQDVMLACTRPEGISALNILPARVEAVRLGDGPGALVQLRAGSALLLARVTRRSVDALGLRPGLELFAVLKSVAVAQDDVGRGA